VTSRFACPTCGAVTQGYFCSQCGEKWLASHDRSLWHYVQEAIELITHFDSKLLRSVGMLVSRPGFMSSEYLEGRRVRYMSPLRLFVLVSVVYYVSQTALHSGAIATPPDLEFNTFTTPLAVQLHGNDFYPSYAARQFERKMRDANLDYQSLEHKYDETTVVLSKTLVFSLVPVIALLFYGLLFTKRKYFFEHLVIATHFWSFALVLIGVLLPAVVLPLTWLFGALGMSTASVINDSVVSYVLQVVIAVYIFLMLRRVYRSNAWYSGLIAVSVAWSFFFIVWLFRFLLFEVTLRAV
jgi:hypothetical protein